MHRVHVRLICIFGCQAGDSKWDNACTAARHGRPMRSCLIRSRAVRPGCKLPSGMVHDKQSSWGMQRQRKLAFFRGGRWICWIRCSNGLGVCVTLMCCTAWCWCGCSTTWHQIAKALSVLTLGFTIATSESFLPVLASTTSMMIWRESIARRRDLVSFVPCCHRRTRIHPKISVQTAYFTNINAESCFEASCAQV